MQILREDLRLEGNDDRKLPDKIHASLAIIDETPTIFVPDFAPKAWEFPSFPCILTDTS
jgi:hypothetical protein